MLKHRFKKRIISFALAIILTLSLIPALAFTVSADAAEGISVKIQAQTTPDGFIIPRADFTVKAGLAAEYGYAYSSAVTATDVTALDALVAIHIAKFGADKTAVNSALAVTSSITKLFGIATTDVSFFLNGSSPKSNVIFDENDPWAMGETTYNGYTIDATVIKANDLIEFFVYIDPNESWCMDFYSWYEYKGIKTDYITAKPGEDIALTLKGYIPMFYGMCDDATIAKFVEPLTDFTIVSVDNTGKFGTSALAVSDDDGEFTLKFAEEGTYTISSANISDYDEYTFSPWLTIKVELTEADKIAADLKLIEDTYKGKTALSGASINFVLPAGEGIGAYSNPLETVQYGTGDGEYSNMYDYLKGRAAEITGRPASEIEVTADAITMPGTVASGTPMECRNSDTEGNLTPQYSQAYITTLFLSNVKFTIKGSTVNVGSVYFKMEPKLASDEKKVELEASAIKWETVRGTNTDPEYITTKLGKPSTGTIGNLPALCHFSSTIDGVTLAWSLIYTGEGDDPKALTLSGSSITYGKRPNVGEPNAPYTLRAAVTSRVDTSISETVDIPVVVPAFKGFPVIFKVTPEDAILKVFDTYYSASTEVDAKYITEKGGERAYTLHGNVTDTTSGQSFSYEASKAGYITTKGTITAKEGMEEKAIELVQSSEDDAKLLSLEVTSPAANAASITVPMSAFDKDTYTYEMEIGGMPSVTIRPTAIAEGAAISVSRHSSAANANNSTLTPTSVNSGSTSVCYLKTNADEAETIITITVTAPASSTQAETTKVYTLKVKRNNITYPMTALTLTASGGSTNSVSIPHSEGSLMPSLEVGGLAESYVYLVNNSRTGVTLRPTAANCTITINGESITSAATSGVYPLEVGNNNFTIVVTPASGDAATYNIVVRRKQPVLIDGLICDDLITRGDIGAWIYTYYFPASKDTISFTPDIPDGAVVYFEGTPEIKYNKGEAIELAVDAATVTTYRTAVLIVSKDFEQDGKTWTDAHRYVISFYRLANNAPDAVDTYVPAPGQFVNQSGYIDPQPTLGASGLVTLGAYGGSIVYKFDNPLVNDANNPYGIDFIVYGNAFTNNDGSSASAASEPAAVMVSEDGNTWYELAGSMYYDATTRHNAVVTYTNPDKAFAGADDVPWSAAWDGGSSAGTVKKNSSNTQAYYPNPAVYSQYNSGATANNTYTDETMTVSGGSMFNQKHSPAYGYGDVHANAAPQTNTAANPYTSNHYKTFNGDGMDLSWAVDQTGTPIDVSAMEFHYVKVYNPTMYDGGSAGECSPEIRGISRANPNSEPVGKNDGLSQLSINGKSIPLTAGTYSYSFDTEKATSIQATPTAQTSGANILVNNSYVPSGTASPKMLTGDKLRIVVQDGNKEPAIYTITLTNKGGLEENALISEISVIPGGIAAHAISDSVYETFISHSSTGFRVRAVPLNPEATLTVDGESLTEAANWTNTEIIGVSAGATKEVTITVTSANGENTQTYTLKVARAAAPEQEQSTDFRVTFSLRGDTKHGTNPHTAFETWIAPAIHTVPAGTTVKQLTDKLLINAGLSFTTDSSGIYITSINGLGEFDNGPLSGWMYTINGTHVDVNGYSTMTLSPNDAIAWHYTDDYTKEEGSEQWNPPADDGSDVSKDEPKDAEDKAEEEPADDTDPAEITDSKTPWVNPFKDIKKTDWFYDDIAFASELGLFNGTSKDEFSPEVPMTRGMLVTVLGRLFGVDTDLFGGSSFGDVDSEEYYAPYIEWAKKNGIVNGVGKDLFAPGANITRQDLAVIISRYIALTESKISASRKYKPFADETDIANYAKDAVKMLFEFGIINGRPDGFDPNGKATRAEVAAVLHRLIDLINITHTQD